MIAAADCLRCGACCEVEMPQRSYVQLFDVDIARLSRHYRRRHVDTQTGAFGTVQFLATDADGWRCVALRGKVGADARCGIYERRPTLCRDFRPGGAGCLYARREVGMDGDAEEVRS